MSIIVSDNDRYYCKNYKNEADLELAIVKVQTDLFGVNRIYLDIKRKIGAKGGVSNIPDGYLIDLNGSKPQLYVVENELACHDPLNHIAVQVLKFSLSFESEPIKIKKIIFDALQDMSQAKAQCEEYAKTHGFSSLDDLLIYLAFEAPFKALVIIDDMPLSLENILIEKFKFGVEVLELRKYINKSGKELFRFEPFLAELIGDVDAEKPVADISEIDTIVVPAKDDGFQETFLGQNRWYAVRISGTMRPQIKYIAAYQVAPVSAITYLAPVSSIEPWPDTNKVVLNFAEPARAVGPIPLVSGGRIKTLQSPRYANKARLESANNLDDVW